MEFDHVGIAVKNIEEYFEEISIALRQINESSNSIYLLGHSTGGLIASSYMNDGKEKNLVEGLILNSPFLDFNQSKVEKLLFNQIIISCSSFTQFEAQIYVR